MKDEWVFLRRRAEQLFDEGNVQAALRLLRQINQRQQILIQQSEVPIEYEQTENC